MGICSSNNKINKIGIDEIIKTNSNNQIEEEKIEKPKIIDDNTNIIKNEKKTIDFDKNFSNNSTSTTNLANSNSSSCVFI